MIDIVLMGMATIGIFWSVVVLIGVVQFAVDLIKRDDRVF